MPNSFWKDAIKDDKIQSLMHMEIKYDMKVRDFESYYELENNSDYLIDKKTNFKFCSKQ